MIKLWGYSVLWRTKPKTICLVVSCPTGKEKMDNKMKIKHGSQLPNDSQWLTSYMHTSASVQSPCTLHGADGCNQQDDVEMKECDFQGLVTQDTAAYLFAFFPCLFPPTLLPRLFITLWPGSGGSQLPCHKNIQGDQQWGRVARNWGLFANGHVTEPPWKWILHLQSSLRLTPCLQPHDTRGARGTQISCSQSTETMRGSVLAVSSWSVLG